MSKKPNLSAVKTAVHKEKFKHGSLAVVFTVVFIAVIIVINVLVSALTTRFPSMNFDLTKEGLNTLSDEATDVRRRSSTKRPFTSSAPRTRSAAMRSIPITA